MNKKKNKKEKEIVKEKPKEKVKEKNYQPLTIYLGVQIILTIISAFILTVTYGSEKGHDMFLSISIIISYVAILIIGAIFAVLYYKKIAQDFKRISAKDVKIIAVCAIVAFTANYLLSTLLTALNVDMTNQEAITASLTSKTVLAVFVVTFVAPLVEEFVFRYSLDNIIKNEVVFIIVSSVIFGLFHAANIAMIIYIAMGVCFAIAYLKTDRNIIAATLVHVINNMLAIIALLIAL